MNRFKMTAATLGLLSVYFVPCVRADDWNKESHLTINVPLQIQGTLLAPGQYVFKLVDPDTNRDVVSIFNSAETRLETIMIGRSTYRADAGDKKLFTISEPQGNQPATLKSWFYPGDNFGVEFPAAKTANETGRVSRTKEKRRNAGRADDVASARDQGVN
jgi:hypothetical protein